MDYRMLENILWSLLVFHARISCTHQTRRDEVLMPSTLHHDLSNVALAVSTAMNRRVLFTIDGYYKSLYEVVAS